MAHPPKLRRLTVAQAVDGYLDLARTQLEVGQLQASTVSTYTRDMHEFCRLAGPEVVLDDLEGVDVDRIVLAYGRAPDGRYRNATKPGRGRGVATQARFRESLSRLFTHALRHGWVQANPMDHATIRPRVRGLLREARTALPREQAIALLEHGGAPDPALGTQPGRRDQDLALRDRALLYLLVALGPRVSEVCRADRGHLYLQDGVTYWRVHGKGGKVRVLPLPPLVVTMLEAYLRDGRPPVPEQRDQPLRGDAERALFLTWRGRRMAPRDVQNLLRRAVGRVPADLRREVTPHGLRHTAFTLLIASGEDPTVVQRLAGHADLSTTGKYRDQLPGELEKAMTHHPVLPSPAPTQPA